MYIIYCNATLVYSCDHLALRRRKKKTRNIEILVRWTEFTNIILTLFNIKTIVTENTFLCYGDITLEALAPVSLL